MPSPPRTALIWAAPELSMTATPESASLRWWQWFYVVPFACLAMLWHVSCAVLRFVLRFGGLASLIS